MAVGRPGVRRSGIWRRVLLSCLCLCGGGDDTCCCNGYTAPKSRQDRKRLAAR
ncbi:hypothetical protein PF005_g4326 [Phytophthora fragariae]|uniref:Uncharacterized protein n=1 Tax=Phytophthora fragariae TaxID=53985 RepID=A0A6A4A8Y1_9STRA|nr:hypothetical protein PF003_g15872 [Phytophthora fragariae]KAE8946528.1 hypothetical protein PF009_g3847 [Phytophthora fragariae]KAE9023910.1 hypothetical protein PF011_g3758 [Phytophthora fragariae]KAE9129836.1 hypothetical protein PF010_g4050 [Phytophthora fragariae]KAE9129924.1 hypothetical protein PF007_g4701 [Phytophthora fragariae]